MKTWRVSIHITPRKGLLAPQGTAVEGALHSLGFTEVREVHVGRHITIETEAESADTARSSVKAMCEKLLANPVTEDFEIDSAEEA